MHPSIFFLSCPFHSFHTKPSKPLSLSCQGQCKFHYFHSRKSKTGSRVIPRPTQQLHAPGQRYSSLVKTHSTAVCKRILGIGGMLQVISDESLTTTQKGWEAGADKTPPNRLNTVNKYLFGIFCCCRKGAQQWTSTLSRLDHVDSGAAADGFRPESGYAAEPVSSYALGMRWEGGRSVRRLDSRHSLAGRPVPACLPAALQQPQLARRAASALPDRIC